MSKRFTLLVNWFNPQKTDGEAMLKDNGQPLLVSTDVSGVRLVKDLLNKFDSTVNEYYDCINELEKENKELKSEYELHCKVIKENEQLKQLLNEAEDIILCQTTPHYQRQWENIKKNVKGGVE